MKAPPAISCRYEATPFDRKWAVRRLLYYGLHLLLLAGLGFVVLPNLFLFGSLFSPKPVDFVRFTGPYVTTIAAIKAYNRDFSQLPGDNFGLPPAYTPVNAAVDRGEINGTTSITFVIPMHSVLEYEFSPEKEGWYVHSPRYDGPLPATIVTAAPVPQSLSRPAATAPTSAPSSH